MEACAEAALAENWPLATEKAEKCRIKWEAYSHFWAAFTDHEPIEQMHDLFSQLHIYGQQRFAGEFAAYCYSIANESEAIRESHGLVWWSIL